MKRTLLLTLAASVVLVVLSGCFEGYRYDPETITVDSASAAIVGSNLDVSMSHHGKLAEGEHGWTFQLYLDADHDPRTGVNGAEYLVNGFEGRSPDGYALRKLEDGGAAWGGVVGHVGSDDGSTLALSVPLSLVPPTAAPTTARLAVYANHKRVFEQTFSID